MSALDSLLACPRCDTPLGPAEHGPHCSACRLDFPVHHDVPWLFADPEASMTEWHNRWQLAIAQAQREADTLHSALAVSQRASTQARLTHLRDGQRTYVRQLQALLAPLGLTTAANLESFLALRTRLPAQQGLTSYTVNLFRDWCWGDRENAAALEAVQAQIADRQPSRVLVLGAGSGRLAYDVHQAATPELTVALDNNPLLVHTLAMLVKGQPVQLVEFPLAPDKAVHGAIDRRLSAPSPAGPGFHPVLADALRPPFRDEQFDVVLTPWFVDVVNAEPAFVAAKVNALLTKDGLWINHGSLAFSGPDPATRLSLPEFCELLREQGFIDVHSDEVAVPYLDCPESRHSRRETVVTTRATKQSSPAKPARHQALPEWLVTGRDPVPLRPEFRSQALSTRIHAFVMSLIDGKRSLKDMAKLMEAQKLMNRQEAEQAIRGFLIKMLDEAERGRGY